jgi:cytidylate kinase
MEGRDIGTVVFPGAKYKFYLDANLDTRIERRFKELNDSDQNVARHEVRQDVLARDTTDKERSTGPLKRAQDAIYIDTTQLTIDDVVERLLSLMK